MASQFNVGFWRLADPKISITSVASMAIGAALAARDGSFSWYWLLVMGLAMFCMEVAKNAWGDVYDYDSGTDLAVKSEDRTDFSGGKRVLVDNILTRRQTWAIALLFGLAGLILGATMVFLREPSIFWLGTVALVLGWSYHGPPLQLAYRGLGELDVVLCYGPMIALATYALLTHSYHTDVIWASIPLGLFIAAFLWVNEFPDYEADRSVGKNNLVVQLGRQRASRVLPLIYLLALLVLFCAVWGGALPVLALLGVAGAIPAVFAVRWTWQDPQTFYRHQPVQPLALLAFVLLSAGITAGILLADG
ncbi:MAG: prenyltransferase [Halioglobus sp.]|nr:prenyltransferase [Halioglobus sp.]